MRLDLIARSTPWGEGGGTRTPLYKLYRYVTPHRVGFLARFGLKTGMVLGGTTGRCMNVFIVSIPKGVRKKEKYANSKLGL